MVIFKKVLKIFISSFLLWLLFNRLEWTKFVPILEQIKWGWILPVFVLGPVGILLLAIRWRLFLVKLGINLTHNQAARGVWTGAFFNLFLPGSTGGDFYRLVFVRNLYPKSESKVTSSLVLDRIFGISSLLCLGMLGLLYKKHFVIQMLNEVGPIKTSILVIFVCICIVVFISLFFISKYVNTVPWFGKLKYFLCAIGSQIISEIKDLKLVFSTFGLSLGMHLISFTSGYFISRALGLNIGYIELALFTSASALILALPISINGLGVREVLLFSFFQYNGFSCGMSFGIRESAVIFSLVGVVCDLIRVIPGGIWFALAKESKQLKDIVN
jgi:hypothetical protein